MTAEDHARPWWQDAVFYEIYVRSFQDSDGDGVGDLRGILRRIPYLSDLGIDAVWLTPFYPSPMADFGYDVADYCDVDPLFGTLDDFDALVSGLRAAGIRTIVDFVPNHTSDRHPWFRESRASRTSPRREWYVWRDPSPSGGPPNNWLSQSGGPAWTFDPPSGQYYLHSFLPEQPDLNWRHPAVRAAMLDVLRFWLARGVDGFRIDVLTGLSKDPLFRDDPPNPDHGPGDPDFMRLRQVHSSDGPELPDHVAAIRAVVSEFGPDRVLVGEVYRPVETLVEFYGEEGRGVHLPFNFNLMWLRWIPQGLRGLVDTYERVLPAGAWPTWVLGNHDHPRVASRLGPVQARIAMMLLLTLRGTPTVYQGDELALEDVPVPPEQRRDPFSAAGEGRGRDPQRAPMPWDDSQGAGFTTGRPWLPLPPKDRPPSARAQAREPTSMLSLTRSLLALRRAEPALREGEWRPLAASLAIFAFDRVLDGRTCRVVLNMGQEPASGDFGFPGAQQVLSTLARPPRAAEGPRLDLEGGEGVVLVGWIAGARPSTPPLPRVNAEVAGRLREAADLLASQAADPFRVLAYRRAAERIAGMDRDIGAIALSGGLAALDAIPGVGPGIASAVSEMVRTGRWGFLDHLRGSTDPEHVFRSLPGVGPALAKRIHEALGVQTLEDLEVAAHSGRLAGVSGIGPRRAALVRAAVTDALSRIRPRPKQPTAEPPAALLLDVDRDYRAGARAGSLTKIAPRRLNPSGATWLPILHTTRGRWSLTALFSNTARAHDLHREHDWVVIYFHAQDGPEGQRTVVTETRGVLAGQRVVRGREDECLLA